MPAPLNLARTILDLEAEAIFKEWAFQRKLPSSDYWNLDESERHVFRALVRAYISFNYNRIVRGTGSLDPSVLPTHLAKPDESGT